MTRVRTALEGSRGFTLGGRPAVAEAERRGGCSPRRRRRPRRARAWTWAAGSPSGDTVTGLSLDVRMRTLVVHQAEGFSERGRAVAVVRVGRDAVEPAGADGAGWPRRGGGSAQSGAEALWSSQTAYGMGSHQMYGSGEDRSPPRWATDCRWAARFVGTAARRVDDVGVRP